MADLGEVGRANVALRADLKKLKGDLDRARVQVGKAGKKTGEKFSSAFGKSSLAGFKTALAGLVSLVAIKQLGQAFLRAALPFNAALAETTTLIEGTIWQTKFLRDSAREMAKEFGGTGTSQIQAFYQAISAGAGTVEEAARLLDIANKLAIGGATDLVTSVDVLTTATNAYSRSNLTAADAADILFVGIKAGKTTAAELGGAIGKVASLASDAGVGFDELVASVAALTTTGISTREAVTGLRAILGGIVKPSSEAAKEAERIGLNFSVAGLKAKGFEGFLQDLAAATGGSTESIGKLFGGVEALVPIISLTSAVADKFAETLVNMGNRAGAADIAFEKVAKSLRQRLIAALGKFDVQSEKAGAAMLKVLVPALEAVVDNLKALGQALIVITATQIPRMVGVLATLAASLFKVGGALRFIGGPLGILAGVIATAALGFLDLDRGAKSAEDGIVRLDTAILDVMRAMVDLGKVETKLETDTNRLKVANERLTDAVEAGEAAAISAAAGEVRAISTRIAANENLRKSYTRVLEAQQIALRAEQQIAERALAADIVPKSLQRNLERERQIRERNEKLGISGTPGRTRFKSDVGGPQRTAAAIEIERLAAEDRIKAGEGTEADARLVKIIADLETRKLQIQELGTAIDEILSAVPTTDTPTDTPTDVTTSGTTAAADTNAITDAIQRRIEAEVVLREEIGATIVTLEEEDGVRERLLSRLELDRVARELDAAALAATNDEQRQEIEQARELLPLLRTITDARHSDVAVLRDQEDELALAEQGERDLASAIKSTSDELVRASFEGGNFIQILANLALRLIEIKALQLAGGEGGGGLLGTIINATLGAIGAGVGATINMADPAPEFSPLPPIKPFAHGGVPPLGQFSLVGEQGPELAFFGSPARIFSNDDLQELVSGGASNQGVRPVNVTMNITTPDVGSFRRSQSQVSAELGRMIRQGQARQT